VSRIHGKEIEKFNGRPSVSKLRSIIGRRSELFENLSSNACCWLLHLDQWAVPKVRLNKKDHFVVSHENITAAHIVEPSLHLGFNPSLILVGASAGGCYGRGDGGHKSLWVGRDEVVGEFDKFRVKASDVAVLRGSESGQVGLSVVSCCHGI
jgi:hypothetical protein